MQCPNCGTEGMIESTVNHLICELCQFECSLAEAKEHAEKIKLIRSIEQSSRLKLWKSADNTIRRYIQQFHHHPFLPDIEQED